MKTKISIILLILLMSLFGQNYFRVTTLNNQTYVYLEDIAKYYQGTLSVISPSKSIIKVGNIEVTVEPDKNYINVNGILVYLSHLIRSQNGQLFFSKTDVVNLLDSLLRPRAVDKQAGIKTIIIDAGHGGKDDGGKGIRLLEKHFNLQVTKLLKTFLEKYNYRVILTRSDDTFIELEDRAAFTKNHNADLFISIHANVVQDSKSAGGIETYQLVPVGGRTSSGKIKSGAEIAHKFSRHNARLAYEIQKQLVDTTKRRDRGVKYQNFLVLRNVTCPAVLLELGFLSNFDEETQLMSKNEKSLMVWAIVSGIVAYHRSLL